MTSEIVVAHANRFGVVGELPQAPTVDSPGEVRVDLFASWESPEGALFMGALAWGGVVMTPPAEAELVAHGRRGLDCLEEIPPSWFLAEEDLTVPEGAVCHAFNPYFAGDVLWSRLGEGTFGGEALLAVASVHDAVGTHLPTIRERYERFAEIESDAVMQSRFDSGELPLFSSTVSGESPRLFPDDVDQIAYAYRSSQRPGVRVREVVSEDNFDGGYWRLDTLYDNQPGVGLLGDQPDDFKLQFVGVVFRDLVSGVNQYLGQGTGWVYMRDDDPGSTRVMPPFAGDGNGGWTTAGGPLLTINDEEIHLFVVPTGTRPGTILGLGEVFRCAGYLMPTLNSTVETTLTAPDGRQWEAEVEANSVGYFCDPDDDVVVDLPGVWTVEVEAWHDGACSGGQTVAPYPSGTVLGTADGRFDIYVVPQDAAELELTSPRPGNLDLSGGIEPVELSGRVADSSIVYYTITMPGRILEQDAVTENNGRFEVVYDPEALALLHPNLDLVSRVDGGPGLADTVLITLLAVTDDGGGETSFSAATVSLQGEQVAVGERILPEGPRRGRRRLRP
jgi:hypothetical protein